MASRSADTPVMRQYLELKGQHPDALLFFRMGDFYEMFFDDAVVAAQALELTLTSRDKNAEDPIPMCGVPHHAASGYLRRLVEIGHKVAICEQIEDPRHAKGIVKRAVTRVVTPGVVLDTEHLDAKRNNFLAAIAVRGSAARGQDGSRSGDDGVRAGRYGVGALDLSTCELRVTEVRGAAALLDELARLDPKEIIYADRAGTALEPIRRIVNGAWQAVGDGIFGTPASDRELVANKTVAPGDALGELSPLALAAAAAALRYAGETQPTTGVPSCRLQVHQSEAHLLLDEATLANLEIFENAMERGRQGSLLSVVDQTLTAMGGRLLRRSLALPLRGVEAIRRRQDAVEVLVEQPPLREKLREHLRQIYDLERLTSRTVLKVATPRELARLGASLGRLPQIAAALVEAAGAGSIAHEVPQLLAAPADDLADVATAIRECLVDDAPVSATEGGMVRGGHDEELDRLIDLCEGGRSKILEVERRERERTGIGSLKIRYNKVFGYFIEVTKANLKNVPSDYHRKQTLANAERYVTAELADHESKVLSAQERRYALEQRLFDALRERVAQQGVRLATASEWVALLDVLCGLAEVAHLRDYVRPEVDQSLVIEIEQGRHPVVERFLPAGEFVPNDVRLDEDQRMLVITGPNMAGKSTAMRQVALITLLAQIGSFVPCRRCRIGVADRIFTRVGASDNLARGESTFMVEMRETSTILANASERSLVVLDEIGRGTATYDGISIAWAVAEHLHDKIRARTMFATHYHELCALEEVAAHVRNLTIAAQEWRGNVVFLRKLVPGGSNRSYGIDVARLAGLDPSVVKRARQVLGALENGDEVEGLPLRGRVHSTQLGLFEHGAQPATGAPPDPRARAVLATLGEVEVEHLTPLQALNALAELVARARDLT